MVVDPGLTPLQRGRLLTEDDYIAKTEEYGDDFKALMGAEAVRELLSSIHVTEEAERLRGELGATSSKQKSRRFQSASKCLKRS